MGVSIIPLAGIALPLFLVPTIMLLKQRHERRLWRHQERMQAIAAGTPFPPSTPGTGAVIAIGAGVPAIAVFGAFVATLNRQQYMPHSLELTTIVWAFAFLISTGAMVTSLILFVLQHRAHARAIAEAAASYDSSKPAYDPDAFDVVSRRG